MKCVIAGSRTITDYALVEKAIVDSGFEITEVVCGECRGPDMFGAVRKHVHHKGSSVPHVEIADQARNAQKGWSAHAP